MLKLSIISQRGGLHALLLSGLMLCAFSSRPAVAQYTRVVNPFTVTVNGQPLAHSFLGGINSPKPQLADLDGDGLVDLFVGDGRGKVTYFKNTGDANNFVFTHTTERLGGLDLGTWFNFCDIDSDGDLDLFCDARNNQVAYYRNITSGSEFEFELVSTTFGGFVTGFNLTPDFSDIDNDGDFDFFIGNQPGGLDLYRNIGDSANPSFVFETDFYDSVLAFPGGLLRGADLEEAKHGYSAIQFGDVDNDNDPDLFYGDIFNTSGYFFENKGTADTSDLTLLSETYLPISNFGYNHPTFGDLDGDGDLDMILGAANGEVLNNLLLCYNQMGPGVMLEDYFSVDDFTVFNMIDIGSTAMTAFGDLDNDNDFDMLIGGLNGRIRYFQNTGSPTIAQFTLVDSQFAGVNGDGFASPELADWDNDGDLDLLVGIASGHVQLWINTGSVSNFTPTLFGNMSSDSGVIKIDQWAVPRVADMNGDNKRDLILGEWDFNSFANVVMFKNVGVPTNPSLSLITRRAIKREFTLFTMISTVDWDGDGRNDLIVGGNNFGATLYRNTATGGAMPDSLTFIKQPAILPGADLGWRLNYRFVDIDNDGARDVFVSEEDGGVNYFHNDNLMFARGDMDGNPGISAGDITYFTNYLYMNGPAPQPNVLTADVDCSGAIDLADVIALIMYVYASGPAPCAN